MLEHGGWVFWAWSQTPEVGTLVLCLLNGGAFPFELLFLGLKRRKGSTV
jgi:hypothetical protein